MVTQIAQLRFLMVAVREMLVLMLFQPVQLQVAKLLPTTKNCGVTPGNTTAILRHQITDVARCHVLSRHQRSL